MCSETPSRGLIARKVISHAPIEPPMPTATPPRIDTKSIKEPYGRQLTRTPSRVRSGAHLSESFPQSFQDDTRQFPVSAITCDSESRAAAGARIEERTSGHQGSGP